MDKDMARPTDQATHAAHGADKSSPPSGEYPSRIDDNCAPIFRRGMGVVIEAIDALRAEIAKSGKLSASVRRYDRALSEMLDHMATESRAPWLVTDYKGAADVAQCMGYGIRHMVRVLAPLAKPESVRDSDTHPKDGDVKPATLVSGAGPKDIAQTNPKDSA